MQALLTDRYLRAAAAVKADTALQAFIAPAGLAWQKIYDDMDANVSGVPAGLYMCGSLIEYLLVHEFLRRKISYCVFLITSAQLSQYCCMQDWTDF